MAKIQYEWFNLAYETYHFQFQCDRIGVKKQEKKAKNELHFSLKKEEKCVKRVKYDQYLAET